MAIDVIRSGVLWSRLESRAPAFDACRLGPARGGLGDAPAAARTSRCRLRSARARINFTHVVELVPYSCASARRGGVDGGGVRRRPGRTARNANEAVRKSCDTDPRAPVRHLEADADPEDLRDLWGCRRGVRIRQPVRGGRPVRQRRRARPAPGAGRTETAWRCGAIMATASRVAIVCSNGAWTTTTTAGLAQGRWMIATGDNDA